MILHVDMDAFYASVEQRDRPELRGKPVVVGGDPDRRGVVSAASYEAREYGVHSALSSAIAKRRCPHAVFLPTRISYYAEVSEQIRSIFERFTPLVEPLSLDEAFLDVRSSVNLFGPAEQIGRMIQKAIRDELQLDASVGVAPNKFLAKLASDLEKPRGFVIVDENQIQEFLDPLPVSRLWGVGKATQKSLDRLGIHFVVDVRRRSADELRNKLGSLGDHLHAIAHGRDDRAVVPDRDPKSISHETTFPEDTQDVVFLQARLVQLVEQVAWRLRRHRLVGKTVQIKVRFSDFTTLTRSITLPTTTDATGRILAAAKKLLEERIPKPLRPVRLIGVGVKSLEFSVLKQQSLLEEDAAENQQRLDSAADQIRARFGATALNRASGMHKKS